MGYSPNKPLSKPVVQISPKQGNVKLVFLHILGHLGASELEERKVPDLMLVLVMVLCGSSSKVPALAFHLGKTRCL